MSVGRTITLGFAVSVLILFTVGAVAYRSTSQHLDSAISAEYHQRVLNSLESLLTSIVDAVASARGYALTGNAEFLEPHTSALEHSDEHLLALRALLAKNPEQSARLTALEPMIAERLDISRDVIRARESGGLENAAELVATERGRQLMEEIRQTVAEIREHESSGLGRGRSAVAIASQYTKAVIVGGSVAAAVIILIAGAIIRREMHHRERAQEDRDRHFNSSIDMLCVAGFDGYFKQVNPAWTKTVGWSSEELVTRPWLDFVHPDDVEVTIAAGSSITSGNSLLRFENRYRCKDGSYRWISWTSMPLMENQTIYCVGRDVTDRRRADKRFQTLFESSPSGLLLADESRRILLANLEVSRMFGYERDELLGQMVELLVPDRIRQHHPGYVRSYMAEPHQRAMGAVPNVFGRRKDGSEIPIHVALNPVDYEDGIRVLVAIADVSERKKAEDRLILLNSELSGKSIALEAVNKELATFSYSVSHDLRAPLRAIDGFSQVLLDDHNGQLDEAGRDLLKRIIVASRRMGQLIDDILALSRVTRRTITPSDFDMSELAEEIAAELRAAAPQRQVRFLIQPNVQAYGDVTLCRAALQNLLGNAWKFTAKRDAAVIEFGTVGVNGSTAYFVRDNGAGFDMAHADKLFGAFQRLHRVDEFEGNGIGLATVQRIINSHGGKIWAEGAVDHGATFYFNLN